MTSKQELMEIMDNRLPGETLTISDPPPEQPPAYHDWQRVAYGTSQHMHQQQQSEHTQIYTIRQRTINIQPSNFGTRSHLAYCASCHATQMTRCEYESSMMTHIVAATLCFTTCCCCLPYFFDNCKNARHYCQNCGSYLGAHNK